MNTPKKRRLRTPPRKLIRPLDVELDTEYSLDECLERLESAQDTGCRPLGWPLHVQIETMDTDSLEFSMFKQAVRGVDCWLIGEIEPAENGTSHVIGQVGISPDIFFYVALWLTLAVVTILIDLNLGSLIIAIFSLMMIGTICLVALRTRYKLIDRLEEIL